jgi:hypothetical protein
MVVVRAWNEIDADDSRGFLRNILLQQIAVPAVSPTTPLPFALVEAAACQAHHTHGQLYHVPSFP